MNIFEQQARIKEEAEMVARLSPEIQQAYPDFKRLKQQGGYVTIKGDHRKMKDPVTLVFTFGPGDQDFYVDVVTEIAATLTVDDIRAQLVCASDFTLPILGADPLPSIKALSHLPQDLVRDLGRVWKAMYWMNYHHYPRTTRHMNKQLVAGLLEGRISAVSFDMMVNEIRVAVDESQYGIFDL